MTQYGPGTRALAELSGQPVERIAAEPVLALRALAGVGCDVVRAAADRSSPDPAVRDAAEQRLAGMAEVARRLDEPSDGSAANDAFRVRLQRVLEQVVGALEDAAAGERPPDAATDPRDRRKPSA